MMIIASFYCLLILSWALPCFSLRLQFHVQMSLEVEHELCLEVGQKSLILEVKIDDACNFVYILGGVTNAGLIVKITSMFVPESLSIIFYGF